MSDRDADGSTGDGGDQRDAGEVADTPDADRDADGESPPFRLTGAWSGSQLREFLAETTVPIRLACHTPSGHLWMLSLWYEYRDGQFLCATGADADLVEFLRADSAVAFEVSVNDPPYCGARGYGTATLEPDPEKALLRDLIERYLGGTDSSLARSLLADDREEVTVAIDPERVATWDYADRMNDALE